MLSTGFASFPHLIYASMGFSLGHNKLTARLESGLYLFMDQDRPHYYLGSINGPDVYIGSEYVADKTSRPSRICRKVTSSDKYIGIAMWTQTHAGSSNFWPWRTLSVDVRMGMKRCGRRDRLCEVYVEEIEVEP